MALTLLTLQLFSMASSTLLSLVTNRHTTVLQLAKSLLL
jgi:hypothetical protein